MLLHPIEIMRFELKKNLNPSESGSFNLLQKTICGTNPTPKLMHNN